MTRTLPWLAAVCISAGGTTEGSAVLPRVASTKPRHSSVSRSAMNVRSLIDGPRDSL